VPSSRQLAANRKNARRCTGPKTPQGKARSSHNACKHGLLSRDTVLPQENPREFNALLDSFRFSFSPTDDFQEVLVAQMATAEWRLRRVTRIEKGLIAARLNDLRQDRALALPDPPPAEQEYLEFTTLLGQTFSRDCTTDSFCKLLRYESALRRAFYCALHELQILQSRPEFYPSFPSA
jgi:hypothetical protein